MQNAVKLLFAKKFCLMSFQDCEHKFVKVNPLLRKEAGVEIAHHLQRDYTAEQSKYIPKSTVFNQAQKEPKSHGFRTMK